ncbi:LPXTG cell wall anchor domain-containing protein [Streptomyces sp. NBC_01353]|uniref:LPXTG cell wall anchor domain-containing protein n=1 Tax=Streptomyces sp. NBC_01353 TaxID=2903835 RepID=UPI002E303757|nr:LPXTG cell wall anchor domain-containing protein [Streptomyces sp. NBC_01353]
MKIRRILATAVAAAVTTPVVFLSAAPAFADTKPAAPAQTQAEQPSLEKLKKAVSDAQKAYDIAVIAENDAKKALEATTNADHPLMVALTDAKKAAEAAATAKTEADAKLVKAEADLAALPAEATAEEKAAAEKVVADAKTAAEAAATTKTEADAKATAADTALDDERVAKSRAIGAAQETKKTALATLEAAKKALADAEAEEGEEPVEECVPEAKFTTVVHGLPEKVVAGTTVNFTLRVTNGTAKKMDEVYPYAAVHAFDEKGIKELDKYLDLEWSTAANPTWQDVDPGESLFVGPLNAKSSTDVKLRLKLDAKTPAGQGAAFVAGDYWNDDESCGGTPDLEYYEFAILAKGSNPGKVDDAKGKPGNTNTTQQGGTSTTPVNGGTTGSTDGSLAKTGSNDAVPQIALAGAAAVALGAGAMFVVRRRKAGSNA